MPARAIVSFLLLVALSFGATGCTSIYHRTRAKLPPEPTAELSLRVTEARQAESLARQAAVRLLDSLDRGRPAAVAATDFNRLEAAAYELERRVLAAVDAAKRCGDPVDLTKEIERLRRQADSWQVYLQANRSAATAAQARQLDALLRSQTPP